MLHTLRFKGLNPTYRLIKISRYPDIQLFYSCNGTCEADNL